MDAALLFSFCAFAFFSTFSIAGTQTSLAIAVLCWAAAALFLGRPRPHGTPLDLALLCFVAVSLAAALFSQERLRGILNLKNLLLASVIYLTPFALDARNRLRAVVTVLLVSAAASALYGVAVFLLGRGEGTLGRTPGSFSTAMTFGGVMMMLCSISLGMGTRRGLAARGRILPLIAALCTAAGLFLSFTRSSWLGMTASVVVILALSRRKLLVPFAALLVLGYFVSPRPVRERAASIFDPGYRTNKQRLELFEGGLEIFKDHWLIGVGPVDLAPVYQRYMPPGAVHVHGHMHNVFLQIAVTTGILGLAAFCFLLVSIIVLLVGNCRLDLPPPEAGLAAGSLGALTGFLVNGLFEWNFGDAEIVTLLYLVVGLGVAIRLGGSVTARVE